MTNLQTDLSFLNKKLPPVRRRARHAGGSVCFFQSCDSALALAQDPPAAAGLAAQNDFPVEVVRRLAPMPRRMEVRHEDGALVKVAVLLGEVAQVLLPDQGQLIPDIAQIAQAVITPMIPPAER